MSRTAHHLMVRTVPHTAALRSLRYSAAELRAAEAEGRRPRPRRLRVRTVFRVFARSQHDPSVARWAREAERRHRAALREDLAHLAHALRARPDAEADVRPARHRRNALWWA